MLAHCSILLDDYCGVEEAFTNDFGLGARAKQEIYGQELPFADVDDNCSIDPNKTLDDMIAFWLADGSVGEVVL